MHLVKTKTSVPLTPSCSPYEHVKRYLLLNYVLRKITHTCRDGQWVTSCCVEQGVLGKDGEHRLCSRFLHGDRYINNYTVTEHKAE